MSKGVQHRGIPMLVRAAGMIALITILARIAGFVRYLVFGSTVGAGDIGTAYATANLVPNVLFEAAAGGALAGMVIPLIAGLDLVRGARSGQIVSAILTWTLLVTGVLAAAVALGAPLIAQVVFGSGSQSFNAPGIELGTRLLRVFAPQLPLYGITIVLGASLQAQRRFFWPAFVPLLSSLVVMGTYYLYRAAVPASVSIASLNASGEFWLGWGTTLGVAAMAVPMIIAARRAGFRYRPSLRFPKGVAGHALGLAGAGMAGVVTQQGVTALILVLSIRAGGSGTLPLFQYGQAMYLLPFAILLVPVMTSVFPQLSELRTRDDKAALSSLAAGSAASVTALAAVGGAALIGAALGIDRLFTVVDRTGVLGVGAVTAALALGLIPYGIVMHSIRVLNATLHARDAVVVAAIPWTTAGLLILAGVFTSGTRQSAEAAVLFSFAITIGMSVGAVCAITIVQNRVLNPADARSLRISITISTAAFLLGALGGHLASRAAAPAMTGPTTAVLLGAATGILGGLLALGVTALLDRQRARVLVRSLLRRPAAAPR